MTASNGRTQTDGGDDRRRRRERPPLSPERIYRAALDIVTRDGSDALTMRRVASALDVEPMSLYHHVPSKKALIDGTVGLALEGVGTFDDLTGTWQEQLREAAHRLRRELLAHPRAATMIATRPMHSEQVVALVESGLRRLHALGFDLDTAADALWTLNDFVIGNVLNWIGASGGTEPLVPAPEDSKRLAEMLTPERFPNFFKVAGGIESDDDSIRRFGRSLDAVIAGIEARFDTPA